MFLFVSLFFICMGMIELSPADVNKKPRMRTADDVISRILWDPSVEASDFVVGYIDRFLGILERPFCEFNWDTNPCDCDYSTELALPRHRIQYFAYKGHHVWDRHSRTDRVFGSTGQSLAPPFGKEEEVKGESRFPFSKTMCHAQLFITLLPLLPFFLSNNANDHHKVDHYGVADTEFLHL